MHAFVYKHMSIYVKRYLFILDISQKGIENDYLFSVLCLFVCMYIYIYMYVYI
jgi:hypothetical protein